MPQTKRKRRPKMRRRRPEEEKEAEQISPAKTVGEEKERDLFFEEEDQGVRTRGKHAGEDEEIGEED